MLKMTVSFVAFSCKKERKVAYTTMGWDNLGSMRGTDCFLQAVCAILGSVWNACRTFQNFIWQRMCDT